MKTKSLITVLLLCLINVYNVKAQNNTKVLEALGSSSAVLLYNTYICIGSIADNYAGEVYEEDYVVTLMNEQVDMIDALTSRLQNCIDDTSEGHLSDEDKNFFKSMILILSYLKNQAQGFAEYAKTDSDDSLEKFDENRELAWENIAELLGIE